MNIFKYLQGPKFRIKGIKTKIIEKIRDKKPRKFFKETKTKLMTYIYSDKIKYKFITLIQNTFQRMRKTITYLPSAKISFRGSSS